MDSNKLANWLQVVASIGLLGGLVLVAIQINQNSDQLSQSHQLARAQLLSNQHDSWIEIDASKQSETFARALAKSIIRPNELTASEILELDGYLFTYIDQLDRDRDLYNLGVFGTPPEALVRGSLSDYFGNEFARAWWAETKWKFELDIVEAIDREMENISVSQDIDYIERIKSRLSH